MTEKELRSRLVSLADRSAIVNDPEPEIISQPMPCVAVMAAYQNANKWLDIIKEELLMEHGSIYFSNYVHELAHTMPERFDKFGDILHIANIKVPYPPTGDIPYALNDCYSIFNAIFEILGAINSALRNFIKEYQDTEYHSMACAAEELLIDIDKENVTLYRMQKAYAICNQDICKFEGWVESYLRNKGKLID